MPIIDPSQLYSMNITSPDGRIEVLRGSFRELMERVPQSTSRLSAEAAIKAAAIARARELRLDARADAVAAREEAVGECERLADAAPVKSFCDGVASLERRLDAFEQRQADAALAEEIRAADEALKGLQDEGDLEPKEAPNARDAEEIEAMGGASSAETAIETDQDPAAVPGMIEPDPEPYEPPLSSPGGLPKALAMSDEADPHEFGRTFLCARDRRAWKRRMRAA
jgi:hypothetical protein